jgi:type I restriction enzyme S subunit
VDFPFKVKSSAIKILKNKRDDNLRLIFEIMGGIRFQPNEHKRYYISAYQNINIALPKPREQQQIAECLTSLDELIAVHGQRLDALKIHEKGLMRQLFPTGGETIPRLRFPEFSDGPEWSEYTMIDVAKFRRGSFPQPYGLPEWYDEENGAPFIQVFDVDDNFRLKDKTKSKISRLAAEQSVFIPEGTLIITLQGSIGRVAITQYDAYIDRTLLLFEKFLKPIDKLFFAYIVHNLFEVEKENAPGGIIKTITKEALSDFKIKLPCILEQQKIAACLFPIDELISAQTQKLDALKTHKIGVMQQLFPSPEGAEA